MTAVGMGVVYARTSGGIPLRRPLAAAEREQLLARHYHPHHKLLLEAVDASLRDHGRCLVLDGHSFPSAPLPYELDQSPQRAEICIGTDDFHTPGWVAAVFTEVFRQAGFTVALNRPFAGAIVPLEHYRRERRLTSIMIEINRALYLDEASGNPLRSFGHLARQIHLACRRACWMVMQE
jgi:N-formylglutamate amidohydrolase